MAKHEGVPTIAFYPPYDIHLMRGQSVDISGLLRLGGEDAKDYIKDNNKERRDDGETKLIKYAFEPRFMGAASETGGKKSYSGLNLTIVFGNNENAPDCIIDATKDDLADPNTHIRNFVISAVVTNTKDGKQAETFIRIHLHRDIQKIWISPSPLTIHPAYDDKHAWHEFVPSILALFDDGVVAKINQFADERDNYSKFVFKRLFLGNLIKWKVDKTKLTLNENTFDDEGNKITYFSRKKAEIKFGTHDIEVELLWNKTKHSAKGKLIVSDQLSSSQTAIKASLVAGGNCPGFKRAHEVPNILFLSDGYLKEDEIFFNQQVEDYVKQLMTNKLLEPFGMLSGSINFWKAFIPSRERGATIGQEVVFGDPSKFKDIMADGIKRTVEKNEAHYYTTFTGKDIKTPDDFETWNIITYLWIFGLSTKLEMSKSDRELVEFWAGTTKFPKEFIERIIDIEPTDEHAKSPLLAEWKATANRQRLADVDNILGVTVNCYDSVDPDDDYSDFGLNHSKLTREDLNEFLSGLKDDTPQNNPIGQFFVQNQLSEKGKDFDNIVILSTANKGRVNNSEGYLFCRLKSYEAEGKAFLNESDPNAEGYSLYIPMIHKLGLPEKAVMTHEILHSFGLNDEYAEPIDIEHGTFITDELAKGANFVRFDGKPSEIDSDTNIQAREDLLNGGQIDPYKIKWRYHRTQYARRVEKIEMSGADIIVTAQGDIRGFAKLPNADNVVFLRKRTVKDMFFLKASKAKGEMRFANDQSFVEITNNFLNKPLTKQSIRKKGTQHFITLSYFDKSKKENRTIELPLAKGYEQKFKGSTKFTIYAKRFSPVNDVLRTPDPASTKYEPLPDKIENMVSPELVIKESKPINEHSFRLVLGLLDPTSKLQDALKSITQPTQGGNLKLEDVIVYVPMLAPIEIRTPEYKYREIIAKKVLDHLKAKPHAFNAVKKTDGSYSEIIDHSDVSSTKEIPIDLVEWSKKQKKEIVGLYSGGQQFHGAVYHPTAGCNMRTQSVNEDAAMLAFLGLNEFAKNTDQKYLLSPLCAVCRYTVVNMIDPSKHYNLDRYYMLRRVYPDGNKDVL